MCKNLSKLFKNYYKPTPKLYGKLSPKNVFSKKLKSCFGKKGIWDKIFLKNF
jgi:hypothetical protein